MGLDVYLKGPGISTDDEDSDKYPAHLFKKNYLRSSYNGAGFNNWVRASIGKDLYWVFGDIAEGEYDKPVSKKALREARVRAIQLAVELENTDNLAVDAISSDIIRPEFCVKSDEEALAAYRAEIARFKAQPASPFSKDFTSYSNAAGHWFTEGLTVRALLVGKDVLGRSCLYMVFDGQKDWYVEAANIVIEFIDRALACPRPRIAWSS